VGKADTWNGNAWNKDRAADGNLVAAYTGHGSDFQELKRANVEILENAVTAVEKLCPMLQFWTLQTGGKVQSCEEHPRIKTEI